MIFGTTYFTDNSIPRRLNQQPLNPDCYLQYSFCSLLHNCIQPEYCTFEQIRAETGAYPFHTKQEFCVIFLKKPLHPIPVLSTELTGLTDKYVRLF